MVPGGTVTVPGGTVTVTPEGTVTVPDGNTPGGNTAGGNTTSPSGNGTGQSTVPGGTVGPPAGGPGELIWSADFEGCDLRGFDHTPWNQVGSGKPQIVALGNGTKALALTIPAGGARNEVVPDMASLREGDDLYFGFSTHLAPGFPVDGPWQILAQWKNDGTGSPPVELKVQGGRFLLDGGYGYPGGNRHFQYDLGPATTGQWANWVFHIRFSDNGPPVAGPGVSPCPDMANPVAVSALSSATTPTARRGRVPAHRCRSDGCGVIGPPRPSQCRHRSSRRSRSAVMHQSARAVRQPRRA